MSERLEKLKAQKAQIEARLAKLEAAEKAKERKLDTRRKVILGGLVVKSINEGTMPPAVAAWLRGQWSAIAERDRSILESTWSALPAAGRDVPSVPPAAPSAASMDADARQE